MLTVFLLLVSKQTYARYYLILLKTNQKYTGELKRAISGLSQSNQWRLGKSDGEPGTPLPATKSDRQSQKVGLGNLSLNSPNLVAGNMFQDLDCNSTCVPLDKFGIWSNFIEILDICKGWSR